MPATRSPRRPASERQLNFLRSLAQERTGLAVANPALAAEVQDTLENGFIARDLIDRVMATPRDGGSAPAARQDGEEVPAPSTATRAGRMLLAGGIEATATFRDGRHATVTIRTRKRSGRGWTNAALGEADSRTNISILGSKIGWLNVDEFGGIRVTLRTRREEYRAAVLAIFNHAAGLLPETGNVERVQEASRCGRCFRTLTDPVSIDRGIGPECFGRDTGSQHIAAERRAAGQDVVAEPAAPRTETVYRNRADALAAEQRRFEEAEAEMNRLVAEGERREHERAYEQEAREERAAGLVALAAAAENRPTGDAARARDLIAEALDAYFGEPETSFALRIFDQLAAR